MGAPGFVGRTVVAAGILPEPIRERGSTRAFRVWGGRIHRSMLEALISFLIFLILVVAVAALILWAVGYFLPEMERPARYVVGAIALIALLIALLHVVRGQPLMSF
jgi:hypothetical protein